MIRIEPASPSDVEAVRRLLGGAGLPVDGLAGALAQGLVAREDDVVVGAAALEAYGEVGLLRSVVVAPGLRGSGVGRRLVEAAEGHARAVGLGRLYLLTETAQPFFARLGYEVVHRADVAAAVRASGEFTGACPGTAVAMTRRLAPAGDGSVVEAGVTTG